MSKATKALAALALMGVTLSGYAQPVGNGAMVPLAELTKRKNWQNDPSEVGFVGLRCATAYKLLADYLKGVTNRDADTIEKEKGLRLTSEVFFSTGALNMIQAKFADEYIMKTTKTMLDTYGKMAMDNKRLNNVFGSDLMFADMQVCKTNYPMYEKLLMKDEKK